MTEAERRFWNLVRNRTFLGLKFVRQYPIGPFNSEGYSVLRFWNTEILRELDGVRELLRDIAEGDRPSPGWRFSPATLSPAGERGAASEDKQ